MGTPGKIVLSSNDPFWKRADILGMPEENVSETFPRTIPDMEIFLDSFRGAKGSVLQRMEDERGQIARLEIWFKIVSHYNALKLTKQEDRLVALSGIAKAARKFLAGDHKAGLWESSYFLLQLCWKVDSDK
jgi:hypothetical protein